MTNFPLIATVNTFSVVVLLLKRASKCNISYQLNCQIVVCNYIISRSHAVTCTYVFISYLFLPLTNLVFIYKVRLIFFLFSQAISHVINPLYLFFFLLKVNYISFYMYICNPCSKSFNLTYYLVCFVN